MSMEISHKEISANERQEGNGATIAHTIQHRPSISTVCFNSKNLISNIKHVVWKNKVCLEEHVSVFSTLHAQLFSNGNEAYNSFEGELFPDLFGTSTIRTITLGSSITVKSYSLFADSSTKHRVLFIWWLPLVSCHTGPQTQCVCSPYNSLWLASTLASKHRVLFIQIPLVSSHTGPQTQCVNSSHNYFWLASTINLVPRAKALMSIENLPKPQILGSHHRSGGCQPVSGSTCSVHMLCLGLPHPEHLLSRQITSDSLFSKPDSTALSHPKRQSHTISDSWRTSETRLEAQRMSTIP